MITDAKNINLTPNLEGQIEIHCYWSDLILGS